MDCDKAMFFPFSGKRFFCVLSLLCIIMAYCSSFSYPASSDWQTAIVVQNTEMRDQASVTLGVMGISMEGFDSFDVPHPPAFPKTFLDAYTKHAKSEGGWKLQPLQQMKYSAEYKLDSLESGVSFSFFVESDKQGTVTLSWPGITTILPQAFQASLLDVTLSQSVNMRTTVNYAFTMNPGTRTFQVVFAAEGSTSPTPTPTYTPTATRTSTPTRTPTPTSTPTTQCSVSTDLNSDKVIDKKDLLLFVDYSVDDDVAGDFNCDGHCNSKDLILFMKSWGKSIP